MIQKYTSDEARNLKVNPYRALSSGRSHRTYALSFQAYGELPDTAKLNETDAHEDEFVAFQASGSQEH